MTRSTRGKGFLHLNGADRRNLRALRGPGACTRDAAIHLARDIPSRLSGWMAGVEHAAASRRDSLVVFSNKFSNALETAREFFLVLFLETIHELREDVHQQIFPLLHDSLTLVAESEDSLTTIPATAPLHHKTFGHEAVCELCAGRGG